MLIGLHVNISLRASGRQDQFELMADMLYDTHTYTISSQLKYFLVESGLDLSIVCLDSKILDSEVELHPSTIGVTRK